MLHNVQNTKIQKMIGQTIRQYQFLEILGEGSLGVAYKAQDLELNCPVVIKFLPSQFTTDQLTSRSKAIAGLQHPHIVRMFAGEEVEGKRFLVVEYLPGGTLKSQISALKTVGQTLSLELIIDYAQQVGEALAHAHRCGIVHGNLKAENLLLTSDGGVKITDFALIKLCANSGVRGSVGLTQEDGQDTQAGFRSDIFAFGIVLYEMSSGEIPFKAFHDQAFTHEMVNTLPPSLEQARSERLEQVIFRALQRDREIAYQGMNELMTDLGSLRAVPELQGSQERQMDGAKGAPEADPLIGKTLAGHYCVLEKVGSGAMGVVYRAKDNRLSRHVALKVLPTGMLANELARQRFHREARALSQLNHPNIATIYEFDTEAGMDFLVMEYVPGTTLAQKLAEHPLSEEEVASLGAQIALALESAHEQGLIHRDLKPGNIMVTPKGHVKVLDFGLAKLVEPVSVTATTRSLAEPEGVVGTLPYMSPEQLRGDKVDARSDFYSFGAVLYEMATGRRPFPETHPPRLIDAILHQPAPSPRAVNSSVSVALEKTILKALEKDPERRYESDKELCTDLDLLRVPALPPAVPVVPVVPLKRWNRVVAVLMILVVLALGLAYLLGLRPNGVSDQTLRSGSSSPGPIKSRRSFAVLGFKDRSERGDRASLSTSFSEMLTTELAAGEKLRTVSGEDVVHAKTELVLPETDSFNKDTLRRIRNYLGTDLVISGSYIVHGEEVRLDLRLHDTASGEIVTVTASATGTKSDPVALIRQAGMRLREKLGIEQLTMTETAQLRASQPSNREAAQLYSEGLYRLRLFDALEARDLLERAVAADPDYALAHSALATTFSALGYGERAKQEAKKAFDLSANLSREQQLLVEGRYREAERDWQKEAEVYRTLFDYHKDNLEYGLQLASAQISDGKGREALATIELLRKLPPPDG
ncbi:MAG: protein kinase, partial [Acidobacteria bacterium]|nr:protein kinase [Acidobacteriota bacterium]